MDSSFSGMGWIILLSIHDDYLQKEI